MSTDILTGKSLPHPGQEKPPYGPSGKKKKPNGRYGRYFYAITAVRLLYFIETPINRSQQNVFR